MLNQESPIPFRLKLIAITCLLFNCLFIYPQGHDLIFQQIFLDQGLSQSIVKCIIQDREGFMYFGTEDGLNRYDGYTFIVMRNNPENLNSISYNDINSLHLDADGNIWIGTFNSGLNKYNPYTKKIIRFIHNPLDQNSISHNNINAICSDSSGIVWVGTDNGLNQLIPQNSDNQEYLIKRYFYKKDNLDSEGVNSVQALLMDRSQNLWIGTANGLSIFFNNKESVRKDDFIHYKSDIDDVNTLSNNIVRIIYQDKDSDIWIGTDNGFNKVIQNSSGKITNFKRYLNVLKDSFNINQNEDYALCDDN